MQLNFFATESASATTSTNVTNSSAPDTPPTIGEKFGKLWRDYVAAVDAWASDLSRLSSVEQTVLRSEDYMAAIKPMSTYDAEKLKLDTSRNIRSRIKRHAEQVFGPPGGKLDVDDGDLNKQFPLETNHAVNFDPAALWVYLEKKYGGSAGQEIAHAQAAQAFIHAFSLRQSSPMERKGGFVILSRSVWIDDHYKKWNKENRPSHSSQQSIADHIGALIGFATWAERHELKIDLHRLREAFCAHGFSIETRKQYACGDKGEIVIVTFNKSFEYRIREDVANQLNLFIGTYGQMGD